MTWHGGHRPEHWWGGKVYSYDDLVRVCELGEGRGLCGWNCKHSYYAFVDGFSARTYTDEQLEELEAKEQEEHEYKGKSTMHTRHHRHNGRWKRPCGHREQILRT